MKFLSSSSSSASSTITTATSIDGNVNSPKSATAGCIAGVFRRLLCLNSLPTYPSDHFREIEQDHSSVEFDCKLQQCVKSEVKFEGSAKPNIVARLMGLESLPQIDLLKEQKGSVNSSISRSRSMNYVDSLKELDQSIQDRHRRVKSFRETPTFLDLEDENFLILSFENGADQRIKLAIKGRKPEINKNKRRESVYGKNKENQCDAKNGADEELEKLISDCTKGSRIMVSYDNKLKDASNTLGSKNSYDTSLAASELTKFAKPTSQKPDSTERSRRRIKKRKDECLPANKIQTEPDSENSSPNSVLDSIDFSCDAEDTNSGAVPRLKNSKTRRTLTEELENYRKLNLLNGQSLMRNSFKSKSTEGKCVQLGRKYGEDQRFVEMWDEICRMAETDTINSSWVQNNIHKFEDFEEISTELELKILDQLVNEVLDLLPLNFS